MKFNNLSRLNKSDCLWSALNEFCKLFVFYVVSISSSFASDCSGGTTVISSTVSVFTVPNDNSCVDITSGGAISESVGDPTNLSNARSNVTINNSGLILSSGNYPWGVYNSGSIANLNNSGSILLNGPSQGDGQGLGVYNSSGGTITSFNNSGSIEVRGIGAVGILNQGTIQTLTNTGSISGTGIGAWGGIYCINGTENLIINLNNAQGGNGSNASTTALTYYGQLPTNYNIIIYSKTHYGQLSGLTTWGTTTFGIYNGGVEGASASVLAKGTYSSVLTGITSSKLSGATTGNYKGFTWSLINSSGNVWDLVVTGASTVDTQSSVNSLASKLRGAFSGQTMATNFANMNTYDCNLFDAKGLCISVGGQQTYVDSPSANMTSAVVVAGYKVSPTLRVGGFLNQNVNSNTGSNVDISNNTPLIGLFAVWNQNENHLGYQVKIANAYQDMDVTTTRDVIGSSEAGRGKTDLNTQSYVGELSYAFLTNEDKTLVRPYAAVRYTRIKQDGYSELATTAVTAPLTYSALSDRSTAALVGVKLNHKLTDKVNLKGSLGVEQDLNHDVDNLTASGVSGLTSEAFNNNINRTRPVASIGAYYMPVKNQRIAADVYYQELPFQSTAATTAYVNYTIGF